MDTDRIHRAISPDGTQVAGRAHGHGPPLVLVPGGPGDAETSFRFLEPRVAERFTCLPVSTRGKGLSADSPDHSAERLVEDVVAFIDSVGEPVALFGHSSGGVLALEAAARAEAVTSLALYEPAVFEGLSKERASEFRGAVAALGAALEAGQPVEASRIFFERIALANEEEMPVLTEWGVMELMAPNLPAVLRQIEQSGPPHLSEPALPERIEVPVLVLRGTRTNPLYAGVVDSVAERLSDVRVVHVEGAGHLGPQLAPERVATALLAFLAGAATRA